MKLYTLSLILTVILIFSIGCNAENPICSTNFCAIGEVFPRSELDDNQPYSEVDIDDSVIFATLIGGTTPVETIQPPAKTTPVPVETNKVVNTTIAAIVNDTASGNKNFEGKLVELTATVRWISGDSGAFAFDTNNDNVRFFVSASGDSREGTFDQAFIVGRSYTLRLYVEMQQQDAVRGGHNIWSYPVDDIIKTTVNAIVSNTVANGTRFEGKVVEVTSVIKNVFANGVNFMTLENDQNIPFHVTPFGDFDRKRFSRTFIEGNSYTLHLYIVEQKSGIQARVRSRIIKAN